MLCMHREFLFQFAHGECKTETPFCYDGLILVKQFTVNVPSIANKCAGGEGVRFLSFSEIAQVMEAHFFVDGMLIYCKCNGIEFSL